jgi:hypothetical protein
LPLCVVLIRPGCFCRISKSRAAISAIAANNRETVAFRSMVPLCVIARICSRATPDARAEGRDPRFLVIVLRGGLDGLAVVAPVGDPDWRKLRGDKGLALDGPNPALPLDDFFALNPAMPNLHRLYRAGQGLVVHAVATPYRERSHFDGQDVLESGLAAHAPRRSCPVSDETERPIADGRGSPPRARRYRPEIASRYALDRGRDARARRQDAQPM